MDPNLTPGSTIPTQQPKDLKTQLTETSNEFIKDNYEGFLHKLIGIMFSILKFIKNSLMSMINMAMGKG